MKSIKEFNTTGMDLFEREKLFENTIPVKIGEIVYKAGDAFDYTKCVVVNENNQKQISMFWNSLYFDDEEKAEFRTRISHANYGEYQESCWR